jgi:hypothetical protein
MALVLAAHSAGPRASAAQRSEADAAAQRLAAAPAVLVQSLLVLAQRGGPERAKALLAQVRGDQPTFDRAQALLWLHQALGGRPALNIEPQALAAPWVAAQGSGGDPVWRLPDGAARPASVAPAAGARAAVAFVSYESSEAPAPGAPTLPLRIERTLWRVVPQDRPKPAPAASAAKGTTASVPATPADGRLFVKLEAVSPGTALDSNTLYLDQFVVQSERALRWALLEAALPPGAAVEASTWGLDLADAKTGQATPLERATHQATPQGYAVPLDQLAAGRSFTVRHLVRFAQRGSYKLPPARVYRMYEPEAKATETGGRWSAMEVR